MGWCSWWLPDRKCKLLCRVQLFVTPWTAACQAPQSIGFSRQECWSELPFPSPGESSWPRDWSSISCVVGRFFTVWATWVASGLPLEDPIISWLSKQQGYYLEILLFFSISTRGWERQSKKCWNSSQCILLLGYSSGKWLDQRRRKLKLYSFHSCLAHFPKVLLASRVWG